MHVYRVEDPVTKKNKVVHRNFILPVQFLPISQSDAESTVLSTLSNDGLDMKWTEKEGTPVYADEDYDDQRTAAWVFQTEGPEIHSYESRELMYKANPHRIRYIIKIHLMFSSNTLGINLTGETQVNNGVKTIRRKILWATQPHQTVL